MWQARCPEILLLTGGLLTFLSPQDEHFPRSVRTWLGFFNRENQRKCETYFHC
jgi:hypothetical protein